MIETESLEASNRIDQIELQLTANGSLRHLLTLDGCSRQLLTSLLDRAEAFLRPLGTQPARAQTLAGKTVANLFFEPSTRTRASFELAAKRLGGDVLNLNLDTSSRTKGESLLDTVSTLQAMGVDIFVVRDANPGVPAFVAHHVMDHVAVLNAGEANISHPTQGLLDLLTIRRQKGGFENLIVSIVGDIAHSRVARSAAQGLLAMGVRELRMVAPESLAVGPETIPGVTFMHDLQDGLTNADVVMGLRIQRERIQNLDGIPDVDHYYAHYGLTNKRLKLAAADAIVMHPGPINRGVEIEGALADGPQSVIQDQVTNGVAVRMALLEAVLETATTTAKEKR